jgi:hypothetical protein
MRRHRNAKIVATLAAAAYFTGPAATPQAIAEVRAKLGLRTERWFELLPRFLASSRLRDWLPIPREQCGKAIYG